MSDKDDIVNKIKAILSKNTKNGASVDETVAAIAKAKKLMEKYNITIEDIKQNKINKKDFEYGFDKTKKKVSSIEYLIGSIVAEYTETECFTYSFGKNNNKLVFFGLRQDVELAKYIMTNCEDSAYQSWILYKSMNNAPTTAKKAFYVGFCQKINIRIKQLIGERAVEHTGNQLIVLKNQLVKQHLKENMNGTCFKQNSPVVYNVNEHAKSNGFVAADNTVIFNQTQKQEKTLMITKG